MKSINLLKILAHTRQTTTAIVVISGEFGVWHCTGEFR